MTPGFRQLLNRFSLIGFERQLALIELLGDDPDWTLRAREGTAQFGDRTYKLQVLGTRSSETNTWLWSWANTAGIPPEALTAAKKIRQVGRKRSIGELAVEALPLDNFDFDAHTLALVATGVAELPAYFRFPGEQGALFASLEIPDFRPPAPTAMRVIRTVREALSRFDVDEQVAFASYVETRGGKIIGDRQHPVARWPNGLALQATFGSTGQLARLEQEESPEYRSVT